MKKVYNNQRTLLFLLLFATLFMGIGFASINSITGEIQGELIAEAQNGVFITDIQYVEDIDANVANSKVNNYIATTMSSSIELSKTNPLSEIQYKVTVYNNSI